MAKGRGGTWKTNGVIVRLGAVSVVPEVQVTVAGKQLPGVTSRGGGWCR